MLVGLMNTFEFAVSVRKKFWEELSISSNDSVWTLELIKASQDNAMRSLSYQINRELEHYKNFGNEDYKGVF